MAYFMLILFSGEAKNCKLHVSKNEVKLLEIKLNRALLFERKRERESVCVRRGTLFTLHES